MTKTVHLDPKMVPNHLRGTYTGRTFKAIVTETVHIPSTAGLWDHGSRTTYSAILLSNGNEASLSNQSSSPWDDSRQDRTVTLRPGFAIVQHSVFLGKDMGLTFHVHPTDAAAILPSPTELTVHEKYVLTATRSYKSSYGGMDRYELAARDAQYTNKFVPTRDEWNATKETLIKKGYLNKAGAITTAGRNAIG